MSVSDRQRRMQRGVSDGGRESAFDRPDEALLDDLLSSTPLADTSQALIRDNGGFLFRGITLTPVGFLADTITVEDFQALGEIIIKLSESIQWILGDYIVHGDNFKFNETYQALVAQSGLEVNTLYDYARVCRNVNFDVRTSKLSFSHHRHVMYLKEDEQRFYLNHAVKEGLSVSALRDKIRQDKGRETPDKTEADRNITKLNNALGYLIENTSAVGRMSVIESQMTFIERTVSELHGEQRQPIIERLETLLRNLKA